MKRTFMAQVFAAWAACSAAIACAATDLVVAGFDHIVQSDRRPPRVLTGQDQRVLLEKRYLRLPLKRGAEFRDLETGERLVADPRALADAYRETFGAFLDTYRQACAELRADYRLCRTDEPVDTFVRAYLEARRRASR